MSVKCHKISLHQGHVSLAMANRQAHFTGKRAIGEGEASPKLAIGEGEASPKLAIGEGEASPKLAIGEGSLGKQSLFTVRTIRNTQIQSVPHRKHITSPLQSPTG
jgi:hypothetical protein